MVSIGKQYGIQQGAVASQQQVGGLRFTGGRSGEGSTSFQARLEAIDRGEYNNYSMSSTHMPTGGNLIDRLNAMGDGELHPYTGRENDWMA